MIRAYSSRFCASSQPLSSALSISEKPMIAFSGVRNSWLTVAELTFDIVRAQCLGMAAFAGFLGGAALGHVTHHTDDGRAIGGGRAGNAASLHFQPERDRQAGVACASRGTKRVRNEAVTPSVP